MELGLEGKVAVVTGASRGIGYATALGFSKEGCEVVVGSRGKDALVRAAREIHEETGRPVHAEPMDLADPASIKDFATRVRDRFSSLEALVHCVGGPGYKPRTALTEEDWERSANENFMSARRLAEALLPTMKASRSGSIVFVLSVTVRQPGLMLLNAQHAAVEAYAKALAGEVGTDNVRVNCVCPGFVETARLGEFAESFARHTGSTAEDVLAEWMRSVPLGRPARPAEVADLIVFLASERASYLTGRSFEIDGGFVKSPA